MEFRHQLKKIKCVILGNFSLRISKFEHVPALSKNQHVTERWH